jgi:hypothetical protein
MRLYTPQSQWQKADFHNFLRDLWVFSRFLAVFAQICGILGLFLGMKNPRYREPGAGIWDNFWVR